MPNTEVISYNGFTINQVDKMTGYRRSDNAVEFILRELQNVKLSNTENKSELKGKNGNIIKVLMKDKGLTISGASGWLSGGLMAAQTGSEVEEGTHVIRYPDIKTAEKTGSGASAKYTVTLDYAPLDGKICDVRVMTDVGSLIINDWTQSATAEAGDKTYSYDSSTKKLTLPKTFTEDNGLKIGVFYDTEVTGVKISNRSDKHGLPMFVTIDCTCTDPCDKFEYHGQFIMKRVQFTGQFDIDMGGDSVVHNFEGTTMPDTCTGYKELFDFVIFKDAKGE